MSEIYVNTITEVDTSQETPVETTYKIEAQRLSQGNVGDSKHPVYFENGIPVQCESGAGGGGGSDVVITPNSYIASLNRSEKQEIATFKIGDEDTQSLYIPRYSSGYVKQTLFSGRLGETTGDGGSPLAQPFTNYEYLYIHIEDTRNLIGSHVITVPTNSLKTKLMSDKAYVSCNLYGTLGMVIKFTSTTGFKVEYVNNLPNGSSPASEDNQISVILTKIEGITLGISKGSWGQNTREAIWIGTASIVDPTEKYYFKEEDEETHELAKLSNYDFIYVYGHISDEDEDHIDMGSVDSLSVKMLEDKAVLTCGNFQNITKTLKFEDDGFYVVDGNDIDNTLSYIVTQIDGVKYGAEVNGEGGDTSDCMKRGQHNVTNGIYFDDPDNEISYEDAEYYKITVEGGNNSFQDIVRLGNNCHVEGSDNIIYGAISEGDHIEGFNNEVYNNVKTEGFDENFIILSPVSGSTIPTVSEHIQDRNSNHVEGSEHKISIGLANHCEGRNNVAGGFTYVGYQTIDYDTIDINTYEVDDGLGLLGQGAVFNQSIHTEGFQTTSSVPGAHAEGINTFCGLIALNINDTGYNAGDWSAAFGKGGHAEGCATSVFANGGHAEGGGTVAGILPVFSDYDAEWKTCSTLEGIRFPHAEGYKSMAQSTAGHAEGYKTSVIGDSPASHAEGYYTITYGQAAHAEGNQTYAGRSNSHAEGYLTKVYGANAHAEGCETTAQGDDSHAEGYKTFVIDDYGHSEGYHTEVYESSAHAEGSETSVEGYAAHAEGSSTSAVGTASHSEGSNTTTYGNSSHAEGISSYAVGDYSHAGGFKSTALSNQSHAEGYKTSAYGVNSFAHGEGVKTSGNNQVAFGSYNNTDSSYALTIGNGSDDSNRSNVFAVKWSGDIEVNGQPFTPGGGGGGYVLPIASDSTLGGIKVGTGLQINSTSGVLTPDDSVVMMQGSSYVTAGKLSGSTIGTRTTLEGQNTVARGNNSHSEGYGTSAIGINSHVEGYKTSVAQYGDSAHSEGYKTTAYEDYSHAEGNQTLAVGENSHTEGHFTSAYGFGSHTEGYGTYIMAGAKYNHAEGYQTTIASGDYNHAEGCQTYIPSGMVNVNYAHVEGYATSAISNYAHTEGYATYAKGTASHAEGYHTTAYADYSHSEGCGTYSNGYYQTVVGKYNILDSANSNGVYAFIVGNGSDESNPSNAFGVKWDGTVHCQGNISAPNVADYAEYFEWYDQNINNEERLGLFVTFDENDNSKIRIANSEDDYILGIVSSTPFVLGNGDFDIWNNKYLKDEYGRILFETREEEDAEGNIINKEVPILNPDYDDSLKYISRKDRPEWSPIGMLGVIITQDDGTCIPGKYCKVTDDGIATLQETYNKNENYYRVTERINEHLIKVVFK